MAKVAAVQKKLVGEEAILAAVDAKQLSLEQDIKAAPKRK